VLFLAENSKQRHAPTPTLYTLKEDFQAAWNENPPEISDAAEHAEIAPAPDEDDEDGEESE
jgi:hypothetical protein